MSWKIAVGTVVVALGLGVYPGFSTESVAQSPTRESLEQKVVRLEKEVTQLRKEIPALKKPMRVVTIPSTSFQLGTKNPLPGKPFPFNGETYYHVPLTENTDAATKAPRVLASPVDGQ